MKIKIKRRKVRREGLPELLGWETRLTAMAAAVMRSFQMDFFILGEKPRKMNLGLVLAQKPPYILPRTECAKLASKRKKEKRKEEKRKERRKRETLG